MLTLLRFRQLIVVVFALPDEEKLSMNACIQPAAYLRSFLLDDDLRERVLKLADSPIFERLLRLKMNLYSLRRTRDFGVVGCRHIRFVRCR